MKNLVKGLLVLAAGVCGLSAAANAQAVVVLNGAGSSAMFLQLGQAAQVAPTNAVCLFTTSTNVKATDTSSGTSLTDSGNAWVAWTTGGGSGTCAAPVNPQIFEYLQTDSVVGNRCLFNGTAATPTCLITNTYAASQPTAHLIYSGTGDVAGQETAVMPAAIATALNAASAPSFAGTDIRPEDAEFATTRATGGPYATSVPACGAKIDQFVGGTSNPTQYEYLGYTNGSQIVGFTGSVFNVLNFKLPGSFTVTPLGATPIVVFAQAPAAPMTIGFANPNITNLNRSTLALYLDGTLGYTRDALAPSTTTSTDTTMATVFVREPLSGTYNTMEYNIPNTVELQTSQDVGVNQVDVSAPIGTAFNKNCNSTHTAPAWNASGVAMGTLQGNAKRRAIGTGQEVSSVLGLANSLGYSFWSTANFAAAGTRAKYLTVDGVDPLGANKAGVLGGIPTAASTVAPLSTVTLAHVADGTYPIWSLLRLVTINSNATVAAQGLASSVANFVTATHPDFVPYTSGGTISPLAVERSHFTPPSIYQTSIPTPQNGVNGMFAEVGGDVGGVVIPYQADLDYCFAYSGSSSSCLAGKSFTGRRN